MMQAAEQSGMSGKQVYFEYTLTYLGETLPAPYALGVTIKIDVNPQTGEDWAPDNSAQKQFDQLFNAVADGARGRGKNEEGDGKSILGILLLAAGQGSIITVRAEGEDEAEAVAGIEKLIDAKFDESE